MATEVRTSIGLQMLLAGVEVVASAFLTSTGTGLHSVIQTIGGLPELVSLGSISEPKFLFVKNLSDVTGNNVTLQAFVDGPDDYFDMATLRPGGSLFMSPAALAFKAYSVLGADIQIIATGV